MITVLYDLNTNTIIGNFRQGHYLVDGSRPVLDSNIVELEVVYSTRPIITNTQNIIESWIRDNNEYKQIFSIVNKTQEELEADRIAAIPEEISKRQLNLALFSQYGIETTQINALIAAIEDESQRKITEIEWRDGAFVKRSHPMVNAFWAQLGYTSRQLDDLFTFAKDI